MNALLCRGCGLLKPTEACFADRRHRSGRRSQCKDCTNADNHARRTAHIDEHRAIERKSKKEGRSKWGDSIREWQRGYRLTTIYGLSEEQFRAALDRQRGCCAICSSALIVTGPKRGRRDIACVDHDHETGAIRGILCGNCNVALGLFGDDPDRLQLAAEYLRRSK